MMIRVGKHAHDKEAAVDFSLQPHLLIAGTTGSGKSNIVHLVVCQLLRRQTDLYLIDLKGGLELGTYESVACGFAETTEQAAGVLEAAHGTMTARLGRMKAAGIKKIDDLGDRHVFVVIDELGELFDGLCKGVNKEAKGQVDRAHELFASILRLGRAEGVHIIAATQRPDTQVISVTERDLFGTRICGSLSTKSSSEIVLGNGDYGAFELPESPKGRMVIKAGNAMSQAFQAYYLPSTEIGKLFG
ncbi:MAG: FtsK/SpoIIIE domain-containing protein [Bacilli bacterium]